MKCINLSPKFVKSAVITSMVVATLGFSSLASAKAIFNLNLMVDTSGCYLCSVYAKPFIAHALVNGTWPLTTTAIMSGDNKVPLTSVPYTGTDKNSGDYTKFNGRNTAYGDVVGAIIQIGVQGVCTAQGGVSFTVQNNSNPYTLGGNVRAKLVLSRAMYSNGPITCQVVQY